MRSARLAWLWMGLALVFLIFFYLFQDLAMDPDAQAEFGRLIRLTSGFCLLGAATCVGMSVTSTPKREEEE